MKTSESTTEISKALTAFSAEVKDPRREANNPHFKSRYVALDALVATVRPALAKHGLSLLQSGGGDGQVITITTRLQHISGEWIESDPLALKADKLTPQGAGSAMTYGRRYSLSAMLNLAWDDNDDDGEIADGRGAASNYFTSPEEQVEMSLKQAMNQHRITGAMMPKIIQHFMCEPKKWGQLTLQEKVALISELPSLKQELGL